MNSKNILVIGSSNTDMVIKAPHLPNPGETILGGEFFMNAGGKGANQSVAIARLGGQVSFVFKIGKDAFGEQAHQLLKNEGVHTLVFIDRELASGVALITVNHQAENCIVVASGANSSLSIHDLKSKDEFLNSSDIVLMQLEIPIETVYYVAEKAHKEGKKVILNPAPAIELPDDLFKSLFLITPNESEASILSGIQVHDIQSAKNAAQIIQQKGVKNVIITLGQDGALVYSDNLFTHVPAIKVKPVDTTAAGDVFNGALVTALSEDKDLITATQFACHVAAISVTKLGAQPSIPFLNELNLNSSFS